MSTGKLDVLPPGFFKHLTGTSPDRDYEALQELWNTKAKHEADIYKTSIIEIPSINQPDIDDLKSEEFTVRFLRLGKDSIRAPYTMLVRDEYRLFLDFIETSGESSNGYGGRIVLGHPGIGKSVFLIYALVERIINGRNTYVRTTDYFYSFTSRGFERFKEHTEFTNYLVNEGLDREKAIMLFDTNSKCDPPFIAGGHCWHVVISSPAMSNYKAWKNQHDATPIWMKPWSWEEIYTVCHAQHDRNHDRLRCIYNQCGPSIRKAVIGLSELDIDLYIASQRDLVEEGLARLRVYGLWPVIAAIGGIVTGEEIESETTLTTSVFLLKPVPDEERNRHRGYSCLDTVTPGLARRILDIFTELSEQEKDLFANLFSTSPFTTSAGGYLFEARFIRMLHLTLPVQQLEISLRPLWSTFLARETLIIPQSTSVFEFISLADYPAMWGQNAFILIPKHQNQATWDLVIRVGDTLNLVQITTASSHSLVITDLDEVKQFTQGTPLANVSCWRIIYVVPKHVEPAWKHKRTVTTGSGKKNKGRDVSEYKDLTQYVVGVDLSSRFI